MNIKDTLLKEKIFIYILEKLAQGATRYTLSIPNFHSLNILVPSLPEQKENCIDTYLCR